MDRIAVVEIITYTLKPGEGDAFHRIMEDESLPLHRRCGVTVVSAAQSMLDPDSYLLVRRFPSVGEMTDTLDAFYASDAWRQGPRQAIVDRIVGMHRVVVPGPDHPELAD